MTPDPNNPQGFRPPEVDVPPSAATSPELVVRFLVGELADTCGIPAMQVDHVVGEVMRRESLGTTGIGGGVALPHTRSAAVNQLGVLLGRLPAPIDWHAIDAQPVRLVCLLLSPLTDPANHLRFLETLVRTLQERGRM
jgi:mannitol/fructose-specific phosphotransferase system IIA component (Ntr-type)